MFIPDPLRSWLGATAALVSVVGLGVIFISIAFSSRSLQDDTALAAERAVGTLNRAAIDPVDWWAVNSFVAEQAYDRDIGEWARSLEAAPLPDDLEQIVRAIRLAAPRENLKGLFLGR